MIPLRIKDSSGRQPTSLKLRGKGFGLGILCFVISTEVVAEWTCHPAGWEIALKTNPLTFKGSPRFILLSQNPSLVLPLEKEREQLA